jgi:hypothetical protein
VSSQGRHFVFVTTCDLAVTIMDLLGLFL